VRDSRVIMQLRGAVTLLEGLRKGRGNGLASLRIRIQRVCLQGARKRERKYIPEGGKWLGEEGSLFSDLN